MPEGVGKVCKIGMKTQNETLKIHKNVFPRLTSARRTVTMHQMRKQP